MGEQTKIQWASDTWNPWKMCTPISPGCLNCYASALSVRFGTGEYRKDVPRIRHKPATFDAPLIWNRKPWVCNGCGTPQEQLGGHCIKCGSAIGYHRRRVFSLSLGDWLDPEVPIEWLADMLDVIRRCQGLDFQLLTKRPELWSERLWLAANNCDITARTETAGWLYRWLSAAGERWFPYNVWIGVTTETQEMADKRIPELLRIPARVRFLSCEPLLERIDLHHHLTYSLTYETNRRDREICISSSQDGAVGNTERRERLEDCAKTEVSMERECNNNAHNTSSCRRDDIGRVSHSEGDVGLEAGISRSAETCMVSLQRGDPDWINSQPQGRSQEGQQPEQSGVGDIFRTDETCLPIGVKVGTRRKEPCGEVDKSPSCEHSEYLRHQQGDDAGRTRQPLRSDVSGDFQNSKGQLQKTTKRSDEGLQQSKKQPQQSEESSRTIHMIIVGGESGPQARFCHLDNIRQIAQEAQMAGVSVFVKQLGRKPIIDHPEHEWEFFPIKDRAGADKSEWPLDLRIQEFPTTR